MHLPPFGKSILTIADLPPRYRKLHADYRAVVHDAILPTLLQFYKHPDPEETMSGRTWAHRSPKIFDPEKRIQAKLKRMVSINIKIYHLLSCTDLNLLG